MGWKLYPYQWPTSWLSRVHSYLLASRYARSLWSYDAHPHVSYLTGARNTCPWNGGRWRRYKIQICLFLCWWLSLHKPGFWFGRHHLGDTAQVITISKERKKTMTTDQNPQMKVRELITSLICWYTWNWSSYQTVLEFSRSQWRKKGVLNGILGFLRL